MATHYVSASGSASWANSTNIATPCSLATANSNAAAGDVVYLRGGTYTSAYINPSNSGTLANRITYSAYTGETPIIQNQGYGFALYESYIRITGISIKNNTYIGRMFAGVSHIELDHCTIINDLPITVERNGILMYGTSPNWVTHCWIHHNTIAYANGNTDGYTDGGGDLIQIGTNHNGADADEECNYNTIEDNHLYGFAHGVMTYGRFEVIRNNVFHNEPWSVSPSDPDFPNTSPPYVNPAYAGKYGHRCLQVNDDAARPEGIFCLIEGNRIGWGSANGGSGSNGNDGADGFDLAGPKCIARYNAIFACMSNNFIFKYADTNAVGENGYGGGKNCRAYNNTLYYAGYGYNWAGYDKRYNVFTYCSYPSRTLNTGNVMKNNIVYDSYNGDYGGGPSYITKSNNWESANGNPNFTNPSLADPASLTLPDLTLQASSGAKTGATYLTQANGGGTGSTTLVVDDALYFQDGTWGSALAKASAGLGGDFQADWIAVGSLTNVAQISSINYNTNTITLASPLTWSDNANIWLYKKSDGSQVVNSTYQSFGAYPYGIDGGSPPIGTITLSVR